jgi:hypothetical protein
LKVCTASVSTQAFKSDRFRENIPLKELADPAGDGALEPHKFIPRVRKVD